MTPVRKTSPPPGTTELATWQVLFHLHPNRPLIEMAAARHRISMIRSTNLHPLAAVIVADEQVRALVPRFLWISLHLFKRSRIVKGFFPTDGRKRQVWLLRVGLG